MLQTILGRACSGKSKKIYDLLRAEAEAGEKCILIVPEQFSYEAEKQVLLHTDPVHAQNIQVYSFRFMASQLIDRHKPSHLPFISSRSKAILMGLAIDDLWDRLEMYGQVKNKQRFAAELLQTDRELKQACVPVDRLLELSDSMQKQRGLPSKMRDIGLLLSTYNAYLTSKYSDDASSLQTLAQLLTETKDFQGFILAVDGFSGFTADELSVLEELLRQVKKAYITFCLDEGNAPSGQVFDLTRKSYREIVQICNRNQITVLPAIRLEKQFYISELLSFCEKELFNFADHRAPMKDGPVRICQCSDASEECDWAAATAKHLVINEGLRYRDIAVIEGAGAPYAQRLAAAFRRYEMPIYLDNERPITGCPGVVYLLSFLECSFTKISTDAILRMLKSGLTSFERKAIDLLDNYLLMYDIDGREWADDWKYHPDGLGKSFTDTSQRQLAELNRMRLSIVESIHRFRAENEGKTIGQVTESIYRFLTKEKIAEKTKYFADELSQEGYLDQSKTVISAWSQWIECLSDLYDAAGERTVKLSRYFQFLYESALSSHAGVAPAMLDAITIGTTDRIRLFDKKAVIVVGVNDGVIPASVGMTGLFSSDERKEMASLGAVLPNDMTFLADRERYVSYKTFSYATHFLFVSYAEKGTDGSLLHPSEIIDSFRKILPRACFTSYADIPELDHIAGKESAFRYLAAHFLSDDPLISCLLAYFLKNGEEKRIDALKRIATKAFPYFRNKENARRLYGDSLYFSPSRVEDYYKCPFQYFCKVGLKAVPRKRARLSSDQNGLAVHYVLQQVFAQLGSSGLAASQKENRKVLVHHILEEYIRKFLPGIVEQSDRMNYILHSYETNILSILNRLADEFAHSTFVTCDTELPLTDRGNGIAPYRVSDHTGGVVRIGGTVDRVDLYIKDDIAYLRIVDYKTGGKEFHLEDIFAGLNMQMLIYLMCLWKNGENRYHHPVLPAGVLYIPAKIGDINLSRDADETDIQTQELKNGQMSGLLLNDPGILEAMGAGCERNYLPLKINKDGNYSGPLITLEGFHRLRNLIDENIANMSDAIRSGRIEPLPFRMDEVNDICSYCDYQSICLHEDGDPQRILTEEEIQEKSSKLHKQEERS